MMMEGIAMAFCINCGKELVEGAKFCATCGKSVNHSNSASERKTTYEGEVHKCPQCGEVLESFAVVCATCGYELRGVLTSDSVREFATKIDSAQTDAQRVNIIRSYPVPNTKEDICENSRGIEVTSAVKESDMKVAHAFSKLNQGTQEEIEHRKEIITSNGYSFANKIDCYAY